MSQSDSQDISRRWFLALAATAAAGVAVGGMASDASVCAATQAGLDQIESLRREVAVDGLVWPRRPDIATYMGYAIELEPVAPVIKSAGRARWRLLVHRDEPNAPVSDFGDVTADHWCFPPVDEAARRGIAWIDEHLKTLET